MRILICDEHEMVREGLRLRLEATSAMTVVGTTGIEQDAWKRTYEMRPDVVVMDISPTDPDGTLSAIPAVTKIRSNCPNAKILALSLYEGEARIKQALGAGITGFLLKKRSFSEFLQALKIVGEGEIYLDPEAVGSVIGGHMNPMNGVVNYVDLSPRQVEVLKLIALGHTNLEIARRMKLSVKTIEGHKNTLSLKLGLSSRSHIVRYALRRGWLKAI